VLGDFNGARAFHFNESDTFQHEGPKLGSNALMYKQFIQENNETAMINSIMGTAFDGAQQAFHFMETPPPVTLLVSWLLRAST
jgi:hypothetical protein